MPVSLLCIRSCFLGDDLCLGWSKGSSSIQISEIPSILGGHSDIRFGGSIIGSSQTIWGVSSWTTLGGISSQRGGG